MKILDEKIIYWKDFLVEVILSWKTVVIITAITAVLAFALSAFFIGASRRGDPKSEGAAYSEDYLEKQVSILQEESRGNLTDTEARDVERVKKQYDSYIEYRNLYQEELSSFDRVFDENGEDLIAKIVQYRISSKIEGVETLFTNSAVDIDDYKMITEILPGVEDLTTAYKYVYFTAIEGDSTELRNFGEKDILHPQQYMISVEMIGNTREVCEKVWQVVDGAFQKKADSLKKIDPEIELEFMSSNYRGNMYAYYIGRKQSSFDNIQKVDTLISNLKIQVIDRFSDQQKAYYNALIDPQRCLIDKGLYSIEKNTDTDISKSKKHFVKILILGLAAGLFISFSFLLFRYLSDDTIKTGQEIQDCYRIPVLCNLCLERGGRKKIFRGLAHRLLHVDSRGLKSKIAMAAVDACEVLEQEADSVYIVQTCEKAEDKEMAALISRAIKDYNSLLSVASGKPSQQIEDMKNLLQHKNVLLLVHNKITLQSEVEKMLDLFRRHKVNVLGAVAITDV